MDSGTPECPRAPSSRRYGRQSSTSFRYLATSPSHRLARPPSRLASCYTALPIHCLLAPLRPPAESPSVASQRISASSTLMYSQGGSSAGEASIVPGYPSTLSRTSPPVSSLCRAMPSLRAIRCGRHVIRRAIPMRLQSFEALRAHSPRTPPDSPRSP
ncbi:hypothetical protein DFH06DRAFT_464135 [Mycena polygramma]|nr:hypothetical protein DFH06DRAFT_464135 [Mycena polygramma]